MGTFSGSLGSMWVEVGAKIEKFEAGMRSVSKEIDATYQHSQKSFAGFDKLGSSLSSMGAKLSAAITLPIIGVGVAATKMATDFQSAMNKVSALGDITGKDLKTLEAAAMTWGAQTKFSATEAAQGMAELAAAGFNTTNVLSAMPGILDLAAAGELKISEAAAIATNAMSQFGLKATDTTHIADVLATAAAASKDSVAGLGSALSFVGVPAKAAGLSLEQTVSALVALSESGLKGERSGTALRGVLESLAKPTNEAREAFNSLGVKITDASGKLLPPLAIIEKLTGKTIDFGTAVSIAGTNGAGGLIALANKGGASLGTFSDKLVATTGSAKSMAETLQKGLGGALEKAKGSIETAGITIGLVLAPSIIKLAGIVEAAANKLGEFAGLFDMLPEPVKTTGLAFVALFAAIGPLLVIAGTLVGSISSLATAFGSTALAGSLALAGPLAIAFGIAIAGWALYKAISELSKVNAELDRFYALQEKGVKASTAQSSKIVALESALAAYNKQIGNQAIVVSSAGKSIEEYVKALEEGVKSANSSTASSKKYETALTGITVVQKLTAKTSKETAGAIVGDSDSSKTAVERLEAAYKKMAQGFIDGKVSAEQLEKAQIALRVAQDNLDPTQVLQRSAKAWEETSARYVKDAEEIIAAGAKLKEINIQLEEQQKAMSKSMGAAAASYGEAHNEMRAAALKTVEIIVPAIERMSEPLRDAVKANEKLEAAYKQLGQSSGSSLEAQVSKSKDAYETIRDSGTASVGTLNRVWVEYEKDRQAAARAMGETIPEEQRKALESMEEQLDDHHKETKSGWADWGKQVSTIITDTGKNIVERFSKLGEQNKALKEDAQELRASLGERELDYADFAANVSIKLADIHTEYALSLSKEEAELRSSLESRHQDYEDFAINVADSLAKFTKENASQADKEKKSLLDSLDDRTRDYDDYKGDIGKRIKDIQSGHKKSVETETKNLNSSLADRKKDYDRYVEDVNIRIARIRARNKGQQTEEEQDLLISLARRTQDFDEYQKDIAAQIGEVAIAHKAQADKEEQEQKDALARRTRDFELYKGEVQTNLAAITTKHLEAQTKEEADLAASLANKKLELDKYETDASAKFESVRAAAAAKLLSQETELKSSLVKQTAEWETYKADVNLKLQEIEDKHLGIFGQIASVGKGVFADIGTALGRFVTEDLVGKLFKELTSLAVDILPSLGKAMKDIFGSSIPSITSSIPDLSKTPTIPIPGGKLPTPPVPTGGAPAPGAPAGGAASSGGGAMGIANMITGFASLASDIFGNVQAAATNRTLDLIEKSSRFTEGQTLSLLEKANLYWPSMEHSHTRLIEISNQTFWLDDIKKSTASIDLAIPAMQTKLNDIQSNTLGGSTADKDNKTVLGEIRDLFSTFGSREPVINVYLDGLKVPDVGVRAKLQGVFV